MSTPITLYDANGRLAYLNRAAEALFAVDFEELGEISLDEAVAIIRPTDAQGTPITAAQMPMGIALGQYRAQQANMWVHDRRGVAHWVANTSIPLRGQGGHDLGAMSIFWRVEDGDQAPWWGNADNPEDLGDRPDGPPAT
jgi:PAS domain-containing protein